jgi:fructose-1,6-bisphosphatase I
MDISCRTSPIPLHIPQSANKENRLLCHALQFSFKSIAYYICRATLTNLTGLAGPSNTTGDDQKKLDVIGNDVFIAAIRSSGKYAVLVSEEEEEAIFFPKHRGARYAVACDPIDGSSNLDASVSVSTIFGIYKLTKGSLGTKKDLLKPGTKLITTGFAMYGASAQLVITIKGESVNGFTMDNTLGEFILTHPDMKVPKMCTIYSVNKGNSLYWDDRTKNYFNSLRFPGGEGGKPYSARYIRSMVTDTYRTLLYGGIFAYPADKKTPKGKLRIWYECSSMAMVFEKGKSILFSSREAISNVTTAGVTTQALNSKMQRMMEVVPEHIHDILGIFMGSHDEMDKVSDFGQ